MKLDLYYGRYYPVCVPCAAHRIRYDAYPHMLCRLLHMCHTCPVPIVYKTTGKKNHQQTKKSKKKNHQKIKRKK